MQLPPKRWIHPGSPEWPSAFDDLKDPPEGFELAGALDDAPKVGIVGTRRADASANRFAHELARELAGQGVTIVSGGALGIDAAAHRGALERGTTIAVLAMGLVRPYPRSHGALFERIAERGALIHEPHDSQGRASFLFRNRLIAALSDALVVVQAPPRSGALSTARYALQLERPLFIVPVAPWDRRGGGNLAFLEKHDVRLCTSARSVLEALGIARPKKKRSSKKKKKKKDDPSELLSAEPQTLDALVQATGLSAAELHVELLHRMLSGNALETPEGWIAI